MEIKVGAGGEVALPVEVCRRYGLEANSPMRIIETENAILLVPLKDMPADSLEQELQQWQHLATKAWDLFPYDEDEGARSLGMFPG